MIGRLCANTDPQRDRIFIPESREPSDVLDHATSEIASAEELIRCWRPA